jgi:hypothetical protein
MKNKKAILRKSIGFTILMISGIVVNAQHVELSPFVGYETGATVHYSGGDIHIGDGMDFGGAEWILGEYLMLAWVVAATGNSLIAICLQTFTPRVLIF